MAKQGRAEAGWGRAGQEPKHEDSNNAETQAENNPNFAPQGLQQYQVYRLNTPLETGK